jgi:hypothetical protein
VLLLLLVKPAAAANARLTIGPGLASCPAGYVCLWTLDNFQGSGYAFFNSESNYTSLPAPFNGIQDNSWSFFNNGNNYDIRFSRHIGYGGDSWILCKKAAVAVLPYNSEVNPPTWSEPGNGWRDNVSSHKFGAFC